MSEIKILEQVEHEQNEFYDPDKSNNGGGYSQPLKKTIFEYEGEEYEFIYDNMSCGDFGRRYTKTLYKNGVEIAKSVINEVDQDGYEDYDFCALIPLHMAMFRANLLTRHDFYEEYEEE